MPVETWPLSLQPNVDIATGISQGDASRDEFVAEIRRYLLGWDSDPPLSRQNTRRIEELSPALEAVLEIVPDARTVIIEHGYFDIDTRSEYAIKVTRQFSFLLPITDRLHFFREVITEVDLLNATAADGGPAHLKMQECYAGYSVIRKARTAAKVGRTLLASPRSNPSYRDDGLSSFSSRVRTKVQEQLMLFGISLVAEGVPFIEQDGEITVCAHVAAWTAHYTAVLRGIVPRIPIGHLWLNKEGVEMGLQRQYPSTGMTDQQLGRFLWRCGLPPEVIYLNDKSLQADVLLEKEPVHWFHRKGLKDAVGTGNFDWRREKITATIARYLNSGLPVLLLTSEPAHVVVACGYLRNRELIDALPAEEAELGAFIVHDDQKGPYEVLRVDHWLGGVDPDDAIMVPLPPGLNLSGADAEAVGAEYAISTIRNLAQVDVANLDPQRDPIRQTLLKCNNDEIAIRTYASDSSDFKRSFCERSKDDKAKTYVCLARMPKYIWVVELIERARRVAGDPPVIGEVVVDATAKTSRNSAALMFHAPGYLSILDRLTGTTTDVTCGSEPYESGRWAQKALSWEFSSLGRRAKSIGADLS